MVKIYNADGLEFYIYALSGVMVASHSIPGDYYEVALTPGAFSSWCGRQLR